MTIEDESQTAVDEPTETSTETTTEVTGDETVAAPSVPEVKLSDVLNEAIEEATKPRGPRAIVPKAEETPEEKEAAIKAAKEATDREDAEAAEKGQVRGKDGKFRAMTDEEKAAKEAAKEAASAKKPDAVNDPIEKGLSERTTKRIQDLISAVKEHEQLAEGHQALFDQIRNTGASPEEFAQMVQYMAAAKSNDSKVLQAAYTILQNELRGLSVRLGRPIPEVNLLEDPGNADLVKEYQDGKLTLTRAHELASMREGQKSRSAAQTRQTQQQQQKEDSEAAHRQGMTDLDALEVDLVTRDGEQAYRAKYDVLVPILKPIFSRLDPRQWKTEFARAYNDLKLAPPAPVAAPAPRPQPLRPKQPAAAATGAGTVTAPKTALEAIEQALSG